MCVGDMRQCAACGMQGGGLLPPGSYEIAAVCYAENGDEKGVHIFGGLSAAARGKYMGRSIILLFTEFLVGVLKG